MMNLEKYSRSQVLFAIGYGDPKSDPYDRIRVRYGVSRNAPYLNIAAHLGLLY